jgi:hypothetical protein
MYRTIAWTVGIVYCLLIGVVSYKLGARFGWEVGAAFSMVVILLGMKKD